MPYILYSVIYIIYIYACMYIYSAIRYGEMETISFKLRKHTT